jgi:hypothetical protein
MRKISFYFALTAVLFMTTASTCSTDDTSTTDLQPIITAATGGSWRVTYYFDTDSEETSQFNGYNFTFGSGNVLTATNGTNSYTGNWSVTNSHSSGDDSNHSSNDIDFNILFSAPANFAELSDDWDIISYSSTKIELVDVSGGNGGTDYITFEKN